MTIPGLICVNEYDSTSAGLAFKLTSKSVATSVELYVKVSPCLSSAFGLADRSKECFFVIGLYFTTLIPLFICREREKEREKE